MKEYEVEVQITASGYKTVVVDAENEKDAAKRAVQQVNQQRTAETLERITLINNVVATCVYEIEEPK
jgi:hypothetical protein